MLLRAWDNVNKKMIYPPEATSSFLGPTVTFDGRVYIEGVLQDLELMTGIEDKVDSNGSIFYINDIVKGGQYNGSIGLGKVIYCDCEFFAVPLWQFGEGWSKLSKNLTIVGNTIENPELIKKNIQ